MRRRFLRFLIAQDRISGNNADPLPPLKQPSGFGPIFTRPVSRRPRRREGPAVEVEQSLKASRRSRRSHLLRGLAADITGLVLQSGGGAG